MDRLLLNFTVIVEIASGGPFSFFIVVPTEAFGYWLMVFVRSMTRRISESLHDIHLIALQVAHSHRLPRLAFVIGNFSADNNEVALTSACCRPTLKRAGLIMPAQHKAAIHFATGHDHRHAFLRIYPNCRPALMLDVVKINRGTEGAQVLTIRVRTPDLLKSFAAKDPGVVHLAFIALRVSLFVRVFIAHVPRADELIEQRVSRNLRTRLRGILNREGFSVA